MIKETELEVCADTTGDTLASSIQPIIAMDRDRCMGRLQCPHRLDYVTKSNHIPAGGNYKTPIPGHLIRLQRAVLPCVLACATGVRAFGERAEFGEDTDQQLFSTLHLQLAVDAPEIGMHRMRGESQSFGGDLFGIAVEDGADDAAFARRQAETRGERAPFPRHEHRLPGSAHHRLSHGVPIWRAFRSHRQTSPSSGSMTSPMCRKPHFVSTRVDAFASGSVCARTTRTRSSAAANRSSAPAASVA